MTCIKFYSKFKKGNKTECQVRIFTLDNRIYKSIKTKFLSHSSQDTHESHKVLY